MDKIRVMAILESEASKFDIKPKLTHDDIVFVGFSGLNPVAMEKVRGILPDIVVLVAGERTSDALACAKEIYVSLPGCATLLLHDTVDLPLIEKAMQAGIRKVLSVNCERLVLVESIKQCFTLERSKVQSNGFSIVHGSSKVITVFGSKGGIGKSTIASNLAVSLERIGKKVAVLDLDLQFGDINLFFDINPKDTIADLLQTKQEMNIDTLRSYLSVHSSGVSVLCAPKSPEIAETIQGTFAEKIVNTIRPYFDYVILDTPPFFDDVSIMSIENADIILQVVTLDISALRNTRISLDIFHSLVQKEKVNILINRYTAGIISPRDAENILDYPIKYKISCDWKTATASLNRGIPIVIDAPRTQIGKELAALGAMIAKDTEAKI